ncbi:GNAT family N-acetyltransferase [Haloplasma contractile]|uniref:Acetyltransferase GNAT family protein n=1 Tax=Haloplasma contractile SSD-17B TaxID=1033810 RepID=U2DTZ7_9MOLU|nr:GNAT family N-acetyltransferase [Haloplasma contractile]ERJ11927.1 Acetyltransferase GNAT family protein [Haloplasma contractile SSD-17B]
MELRLVKPRMELRDKHLDFIKEWKENGEDITPYSVRLLGQRYEKWLENNNKLENKDTAPDDWVPATTYFLMDEESNMLGAVNIRHELNEFLFNYGGHIGYGIRPSERRKGYASKMLEMALNVSRNEIGLKKVLIVCNQVNHASSKTIQKNGGVLENEVVEEGKLVQRFWIEL